MNESRVREWLELVGFVGVIASLIFVGLELRQSRQIAYMDQLAVARQLVSEFRQKVIDNSDVWYRGCGGEELSDSDRAVFLQLALELRDTVVTLYGRGNIGLYAGAGRWVDNLAVTLHHYPAVAEAIAAAEGAALTCPGSVDLSAIAGGAFAGFGDELSEALSKVASRKPGTRAPIYLCGNL